MTTKLTDLAVPAVAVVGGYIVLTKVLKLIPDPLAGLGDFGKSISDFFGSIGGGIFGPPVVQSRVTLDKVQALHGEIVYLFADSLKPNAPVVYGWKELNYTQNFTSTALGNLAIYITIQNETPAGTYTVYVDQRAIGGPYYTTQLTVLEGHI